MDVNNSCFAENEYDSNKRVINIIATNNITDMILSFEKNVICIFTVYILFR